MAKKFKSAKLETSGGRMDLDIRRKPHWLLRLSPGLTLGYRHNEGPVGSWNVRIIKSATDAPRDRRPRERILALDRCQRALRFSACRAP